MRTEQRRLGTRHLVATTAALAVAATIMTAGPLAHEVDAAPNPLRDKTTVNTLRIAADGSYTVQLATEIDLALETSWSFGGDIHDGFRLPDTDSLLPAYLRASYSNPHGTIDSTTAEAALQRQLHSVDVGFSTDRLAEGTHMGILDYKVSGAAVSAATVHEDDGNGVVVYFRPLDRGDLIIESDAPISGVDCEVIAPHGEPCGEKQGDRWAVPAEEMEQDHTAIDAVRITIDADPDRLQTPEIDS